MDKELQKKLYDKYPKIFRQKDLPMSETCMCWGIDTGKGWFSILDVLCGQIQYYCDKVIKRQIEAVQVKEKYGTLRFYTEPYDDTIEKYVGIVESISGRTCEECGDTSSAKVRGGSWLSCRCDNCWKKDKSKWDKK